MSQYYAVCVSLVLFNTWLNTWIIDRLTAVTQKMSTRLHAELPGPNLSCRSPAARAFSRPPAAPTDPPIPPTPLAAAAAAASVSLKHTAADPTWAAEQGRPKLTTETNTQKRRSGSLTLTYTKTTIIVNRLPFPTLYLCKLPSNCVTDSFLIFIINVVHTCYTVLPYVLWDHSFIIFQCWSIKFEREKKETYLGRIIKEVLCELLGNQRKKMSFFFCQ